MVTVGPISPLAAGRDGGLADPLNLMAIRMPAPRPSCGFPWGTGRESPSSARADILDITVSLYHGGPTWTLGQPFVLLLPASSAYHLICSLSSPAAGRKSLTYFNHDPRAALQEVTFDLQDAKKVFFGSFHKVLGTICLTPAGPDPLAWLSLNVVVSLKHQALIHPGPLTLMLPYYDLPFLIWVREQIFLFGRLLQ